MQNEQVASTTEFDKPDYGYWGRASKWTVLDAVILLLDFEPCEAENDSEMFLHSSYASKFNEMRDVVRKAISNHDLVEPIKPANFLKWCNSQAIFLPSELAQAIRENSVSSKTDDVPLKPREKMTYENIIGALLQLMLGDKSDGKPNSTFRSQDSIIATIVEKYEGYDGLAQRTLQEKFAEANRTFKAEE